MAELTENNETPTKISARNPVCRLCCESKEGRHVIKIFSKTGLSQELCQKVELSCGISVIENDTKLKKEAYPYEWMDGFSKFSEPSLPSKEKFFSSLTDENITDEDYEHAQKIWKSFGMKTMRDYHDLYLKTDVLLLADVMERFRGICMEITNSIRRGTIRLPDWHGTRV
ncbi:Hypothetical predicted protein [Paramuricea clavata]|uniref:Uncharacterized protein n=1 Tax=Paramuricea clavata TaxID=317549 RepID=A0A6S7FDF2_PARCT|nr:Hypothetical predicted protein [Paramuricea clavata]